LSTHLRLGLPSDLFPSGFPTISYMPDLSKIHFNIFHTPTSWSLQWSLSFCLSPQYPICRMKCSWYSSRFWLRNFMDRLKKPERTYWGQPVWIEIRTRDLYIMRQEFLAITVRFLVYVHSYTSRLVIEKPKIALEEQSRFFTVVNYFTFISDILSSNLNLRDSLSCLMVSCFLLFSQANARMKITFSDTCNQPTW
jgi:hypothetical protein